MSKLFNRYTTGLPLLSLVALALALTGGSRATYAHHLCGNTGSPYGAFDLQTYEAADYRNVYARTMELAGFNQLFPEHGTFALPSLEGVQPSPYIPPVLLKSIAWLESGWSQASYDPLVRYGEIGPVLSSHDCGYGIMQITSGMQNVSGVPNLDQAMIGGHYAFNIARGARILADKWNSAPEYRPVVGSRNSQIIEDWYFALWGYNGFASKNHPLSHDPNRPPYICDGTQPRSNYPYQELVFGCVAHPPVRGGVPLWPAQEVHLPNPADPGFGGLASWDAFNQCVYNLQCSGMNIPTPNPWHQDPTGPSLNRHELFGDPVLSLSTGAVVFDAVPGGEALGKNVSIANAGSGVLAWRLTSSSSWLKTTRPQGVSLGSNLGSGSQTVKAYASASGLPPGIYSGELIAESLWASGSPARISVTLRVSLQAGAIGFGDFSGDAKSDVAFLCCSDYASLWRSQGTANFAVSTFQPWPQYGMTSGGWQLGYFNSDSKLDMIHLCCSDYAQVWLSNGDGTFGIRTFQPWSGYGLQSGSWLPGDFNGDLRTDLVHFWANGRYANIWLSNGDGSFSIRQFTPWPDYGFLIGSWQSGDFDADGRLDLIHLWEGGANVWLSKVDGSFSVRSFAPWPGYGYHLGSWQAGDFNGDRRTDLIHFWGGGPANVWFSNGDGIFSVRPFEPWPGYGYLSGVWLPGDFNGDAKTDLAHIWGDGYANVWLANGDGGFSVNSFSPWPGYGFRSGSWHTGDFDGDGKTDLFHLCCQYVNIWRANGDGSFTVAGFTP